MGVLNLLIFVQIIFQLTFAYRFGRNCTINGHLHCYVEENTCALNPTSDNAPSAPFDLRVYQALATVPSREPNSYQLWVNVSWEPPYDPSFKNVRGFELNVVDKESDRQWCFSFRLNDTSKWDDKDRLVKFRFWTKDVFEFGRKYYIEVQSLPKSSANRSSNFVAVDNVQMAEHPEASLPDRSVNCSNFAHLDANKWIAAFRYIVVKPWPRQIFIDFIAAPPQYCFEAYELRLLKGLHSIADSHVVSKDYLYEELYGNVTVTFGNHTFENVVPGLYDIAIIPVDRASNGKCLCPLPSKICTCSQAIWTDVELKDAAINKPVDPCLLLPPARDMYLCRNSTLFPPDTSTPDNRIVTSSLSLLIVLLLFAVIVIVAGAFVLRYVYKKYSARDIAMYVIPMVDSEDFSPNVDKQTILIVKPVHVLVIYAHDSDAHDQAVASFVDYLRAKCRCSVSADYLCRKDIAENKFDWLYRSIKTADKIVMVHSYGAYMRYQSRVVTSIDSHDPGVYVVERKDAGEFDDVFLLQLDLLSAHFSDIDFFARKLINVKFAYTQSDYVLSHLSTMSSTCYEIPKHLSSLIHRLHDLNEMSTSTNVVDEFQQINEIDYAHQSTEGYRLCKSLEDAKHFVNDSKDWFERLHVRKQQQQRLPSPTLFLEEKKKNGYSKQPAKLPGVPIPSPGISMDQKETSPFLQQNDHATKENGHVLSNGSLKSADLDDLLVVAGSKFSDRGNLSRNMDSCDSGIGVDLASKTLTTSSNNSHQTSPMKKQFDAGNNYEFRRLVNS